ncbi:probable prefoldin subunit 2 isoform X1 [Carya illinoinensis]|uniref:probable prefoldin subunit 2 isoform X1 n=1 Tax=Carya illinoinensis TaxID=32201 RepID=UPI001C71E2B9|nr:probable prefoldin subunit 2 isoform X1 [Carya illinoinensis]
MLGCLPLIVHSTMMASKHEDDPNEPVNEQAVANKYAAMRSELNQIYSKITELEMEASEHSLVINAIEPLEPSRRCYRMIGGVLVERTIKEVLPAVHRNKEGLEEVIARLNEALEKKKKDIAELETKYKIRIRKTDGEMKDDGSEKGGSSQGVLVGPASGSE